MSRNPRTLQDAVEIAQAEYANAATGERKGKFEVFEVNAWGNTAAKTDKIDLLESKMDALMNMVMKRDQSGSVSKPGVGEVNIVDSGKVGKGKKGKAAAIEKDVGATDDLVGTFCNKVINAIQSGSYGGG